MTEGSRCVEERSPSLERLHHEKRRIWKARKCPCKAERETGSGRQVFSETQRMRQIQEEKRGDEQTKKTNETHCFGNLFASLLHTTM